MQILDEPQFKEMESLLAALLSEADSDEEDKILMLHQRLENIYRSQSELRKSKERLLKLQKVE